jgi:hypothetical protein
MSSIAPHVVEQFYRSLAVGRFHIQMKKEFMNPSSRSRGSKTPNRIHFNYNLQLGGDVDAPRTPHRQAVHLLPSDNRLPTHFNRFSRVSDREIVFRITASVYHRY